MSLYGVMRTSASGMAAQASRISAVSDNVANSNTTGYKEVETSLSSLEVDDNISSYEFGSVDVLTRRMVTGQGTIQATNSNTDLAVQGQGFFIVQGPSGDDVITRAGNFVPDANNNLVNAAGFTLMGYPVTSGNPAIVANGFTGLQPVSVASSQLSAAATTTGQLQVNLPPTDTAVAAANLPSTNSAGATYSEKSSLVVYGTQGQQITLDIYSTKTGTDTWEMSVYNRADAASGGGFPYASGPLATQNLTFDPSNGQFATGSPTSLSLNVPGGSSMNLDLTGTSELATNYSVISSSVNGNQASAANLVDIASDGTVYVAYSNGMRKAAYRIPLANVASPDNLDSQSGNVFTTNANSGPLNIGFPQDPGFGSIASGALEQSTADIASQFTEMIDAQRGYTANSKVFQTAADLMDVLVSLKR